MPAKGFTTLPRHCCQACPGAINAGAVLLGHLGQTPWRCYKTNAILLSNTTLVLTNCVPSGNKTIEDGPVEILDVPITEHGDFQ